MKYNIRGDKMVITDAIKDYTENKLSRLEKYFKDVCKGGTPQTAAGIYAEKTGLIC